MGQPLELHPDRLLPPDPTTREVARRLYTQIRSLPIISPHGHTDPAWFATNQPFTDAHALIIAPDHYLIRMLYSQGIELPALGIPTSLSSCANLADARAAWRLFANHYYLFAGTPTGYWLNHIFAELFDQTEVLDATTADDYFDAITAALQTPDYRPRRIIEHFDIEFLATTESPIDTLEHHQTLQAGDWSGRIVTTYRPDAVVDPEHIDFRAAMNRFAELTDEDVYGWEGYLQAHRKRRRTFIELGATASDHGHPSAATADLSSREIRELFQRVTTAPASPADAELFRAQMLTEMARMSLEDGLVMQIHPGSSRNHNRWLFDQYGPDKGADIPLRTDYTNALRPLLNRFGNDSNLTIVLFTLDESNYSRELAPLAGHYPCLRLGPAWWFHDSVDGIRRFREQTTETAGFYNTAGFNDDTRALLSIPARHDMSRRIDAGYLARLVVEHRLSEDDAKRIATDLTYNLPKQTYRIDAASNQH